MGVEAYLKFKKIFDVFDEQEVKKKTNTLVGEEVELTSLLNIITEALLLLLLHTIRVVFHFLYSVHLVIPEFGTEIDT